jgi:hypothetical protein
MLCPATDNPASCEIRADISFLDSNNVNAAQNYLELCTIYGKNLMNEGMVRHWCKIFNDGLRNVHDEERRGRSSVVINELAQNEA